jgi:xanthine/uracil/vitamin C permease (AzgA family)
MEKLFKLKENGTTVRTELVAGLTTFMTMAYIIALNPNLLTNFDTGSALWNGVFMATCVASAVGMFAMAFLANKPFAMAPGMGLNSFFAVVVANIAAITSASYLESFQAALVIIAILLTTTAKKLFRPIPGAKQKGLLAMNAMLTMPMKDAIQVARNTPFHSALPSAPKLVSRLGFRAMM